MANQSSTTVMFRALVMLACVVVIPLAAVLGTSLPDLAQRIMDVRWPWRSPPSGGTLSEAPLFGPVIGDNAGPTAAMVPGPSDWAGDPLPAATAWSGGSSDPLPLEAVAASFQQPVEPPTVPVSSTADPFTSIQDRLRQMGATYYLLESWGRQQPYYRFYCKVALGGNPNGAQYYFEATDSDPLRAMDRVLGQVEAWRADRR